LPRGAARYELATHRRRESATDGKPESRSAVNRFSVANLNERLEDRLQLVGGYPDTTVGDAHDNHLTDALAFEGDAPAHRCELDGVGEQIEEYLL